MTSPLALPPLRPRPSNGRTLPVPSPNDAVVGTVVGAGRSRRSNRRTRPPPNPGGTVGTVLDAGRGSHSGTSPPLAPRDVLETVAGAGRVPPSARTRFVILLLSLPLLPSQNDDEISLAIRRGVETAHLPSLVEKARLPSLVEQARLPPMVERAQLPPLVGRRRSTLLTNWKPSFHPTIALWGGLEDIVALEYMRISFGIWVLLTS